MASPIVQITSHLTDAKARLPGWLVDATNYKNFLDVLVQPYQDIEDLLISLLDGFSIETAVGVQLDTVGEYLGLERTDASESDTSYRTRLFGRAAELARSGEPETVISVWLGIWTATRVFFDEYQPAAFQVTAEVATDTEDAELDAAALLAITATKAGGVQVIPQVVVTNRFFFGDAADADVNGDVPLIPNNGFGDEADADVNGDITPGAGQGGNWARVIA